jgi:hypothetical protein
MINGVQGDTTAALVGYVGQFVQNIEPDPLAIEMILVRQGNTVTGQFSFGLGNGVITNGTVTGSELRVSWQWAGRTGLARYPSCHFQWGRFQRHLGIRQRKRWRWYLGGNAAELMYRISATRRAGYTKIPRHLLSLRLIFFLIHIYMHLNRVHRACEKCGLWVEDKD